MFNAEDELSSPQHDDGSYDPDTAQVIEDKCRERCMIKMSPQTLTVMSKCLDGKHGDGMFGGHRIPERAMIRVNLRDSRPTGRWKVMGTAEAPSKQVICTGRRSETQ